MGGFWLVACSLMRLDTEISRNSMGEHNDQYNSSTTCTAGRVISEEIAQRGLHFYTEIIEVA